MRKLKAVWQSLWVDVDRRVRLGRLLGLLLLGGGFVVIGKAWEGAASINSATGQLPYLLSGGFLGLGMIITGGVLLFLATVRAERQILSDRFDEMSTLLARNLARLGYSANGNGTSGIEVVAGANVYHRPGCKILQGKENLTKMSLELAANEGLKPCRVCDPPKPAKTPETQGA